MFKLNFFSQPLNLSASNLEREEYRSFPCVLYLDPPLAPPPPIFFVHGTPMLRMFIVGHVTVAPEPLAGPSRSARFPSLS